MLWHTQDALGISCFLFKLVILANLAPYGRGSILSPVTSSGPGGGSGSYIKDNPNSNSGNLGGLGNSGIIGVGSTITGKTKAFYSADERLIIEVVSSEVFDSWKQILDSYLLYMEANPHSLLPRVVGMYKMTKNEPVYLLVYVNMFYYATTVNMQVLWQVWYSYLFLS